MGLNPRGSLRPCLPPWLPFHGAYWPGVPFLPFYTSEDLNCFCCSSSSDSVWNSWKRASVLWWITVGSGKSIGELPLSHLSLHSGCNQHALYFKRSLSVNQHWLRSWLGTIRQQAIVWTNIVQFLWHNFGHNELMNIWCRMQHFQISTFDSSHTDRCTVNFNMVDVGHHEFEGQNAVSS